MFLPALLVPMIATTGCSTTETRDASTPEGAYQIAEDLAKDERYEEAIAKFQDIKNKFPYSRFATMAELKIADLHYDREAFVEAQSAYQLFKEFHQAFAMNAGACVHLETLYGSNSHHIAESGFKALARALRVAVELDPKTGGMAPSTKGVL